MFLDFRIRKWTGRVSILVFVITGWIGLLPIRPLVQAEETSTSISFLRQQAVAAFQTGRFDEAAQLFVQQAQSHEGDEHKAWFNAGASYWNAGRKKEAFQMYEQAVAVLPLYFLGHKRLAIRYKSAEQMQVAEKHRDHALAIRKVEKAMKPLWDKAHAIRTKGGDWYQATVLVHEKSAQAYESLGHPEFAKAERQLAERSRAELVAETARLQKLQQQPQLDAQERANNAKILNALAGMTVKGGAMSYGGSADPNAGLGGMTQGLGLLQQAYGGYSQMASAYDRQLQQQQETLLQQGEQAQAVIVDPKRADAQQDMKRRSLALRQRLEQVEAAATEFLIEDGRFEDVEPIQDRDTLDL